MADEQMQSWLEDLPAQEAVDIDSLSAHPWTGEPQATVLNDSDAGDDGKDHVVEEVTKGVANVEALEESPTSLQEAATSDSSLQDEQQPYEADEGEDDSTAACVNGVGNPETSSHDDPEVAEEREDSVEENPTALEEEELALQEATSLLKLPLEKDLGPLMTPTSMVAELSSPAGAEAAASQDNLLHAGTGENLWLGHDMETGPSPLNAAEEVLLESGALLESAATDSPCSIESPIHQDGTLPVKSESAPLESPHSDVESPLTPVDLESHGLVQEAADVSQEEPLGHHEEPQPASASEAVKLVEPAADRVEPTELEADREEEQLVPSVEFVSEVEPVPELAICPPDERLLGDLAFELTPPATPQQAEGCVSAQASCAGISGEEAVLPQPELATSQPPEREDGAHSLKPVPAGELLPAGEPVPAGEPLPAGEPAVESTLKPKASSLPQSKTMTPVKTKGVGLASSKRPAGTPVTSTSKKPRPEAGVASPATAAKRSPLVTAKSATAAKASPTAGANKDPKGKLAMEGKAAPKPLEKRVPTTRILSTATTATTTKPATDTPPRAATARMAAKTTTSVLKAAPPPSLATAKRTVATGVKGEPKGEEKLAEPKKLTRPSVKLSGARPKVAATAATTDTKGPAPAGASSITRARPATTPGRHGLGATLSSRNAVVAPTPSGGTERKPAPSSATAARTGPLAKAMANRTTRPTTAPEARAASSRPGAPIENGKLNAVPGRLSKDASARAPARTGVKSTTTKVTVKKVETDGTKPALATEVNKSTSLTATKTTIVRTQLKTAGKVDVKNTNVAATNRKPPLEKNTGKLAPKTPTPKKSVGGSKAENHKPSPIKSPSTNGPSDDALAVENGNVAEQGSGGDGVGGHGGSPVRQNGNALSPGVEENANEHHDAPTACEEEAQSGNPQLEEPIHEQQPQPVEVEQN